MRTSVADSRPERLGRGRRAGARTLALMAALAAGGCGHSAPEWDVVLVSLDTTRADHLGPFARDARARTPALDALARESIVFEAAQSAATTTLCAHTSLMTGTWPHRHGVARNGFTLNEGNLTLAELLSSAGMDTRAFLGSFALEARFGFDQGFAVFDEAFEVFVGAGGADQNQRGGPAVTAAALRSLSEAPPKAPLFLFAHYFDPHAPYAPPASVRPAGLPVGLAGDPLTVERAVRAGQRRDLAVEGPVPGLAGAVQAGLSPELVSQHDPEPAELDRQLAALYAAEVEALDASLGALFEGLRASGRWERTIVIVTGDHGETFTEHPDRWNHGLGVHQTVAHVPLMVRLPQAHPLASARGLRVREPVATIDVLPTVCGLLGLEPPPTAHGVNLVPFVQRGEDPPRRALVTEATQPWQGLEEGARARGQWLNWLKPHAVREGRWKYINAPYLQLEHLYDLEADPGEQRDLLAGVSPGGSPADPEAAGALRRLRAQLLQWFGEANPLPSGFDPSQAEETAARLRQMGY